MADSHSHISSGSNTCARCALKNFKDLAYQYRAHLSNDDFPGILPVVPLRSVFVVAVCACMCVCVLLKPTLVYPLQHL